MHRKSRWFGLHGLLMLVLVVPSLGLLLFDHWQHLAPYLPFLVLLACPLMHVFMHKSHGHSKGGEDGGEKEHGHE